MEDSEIESTSVLIMEIPSTFNSLSVIFEFSEETKDCSCRLPPLDIASDTPLHNSVLSSTTNVEHNSGGASPKPSKLIELFAHYCQLHYHRYLFFI